MGSTFRYSGDELYHYGRSINDGAPGVGTGNWRRSGSKKDVYAMIRDAYGKAGESVEKMKNRVATSKLRIANRVARVKMKADMAGTKVNKTIATSKENFHKNKMETLQRKTEEQEAKNKLLRQQTEGDRIQSEADRQEARNQREEDRQRMQDEENAKKKQVEQDAKDTASVNGAKVWRSWSNEELQAYINRQNLEKQADAVRMNQLDRPRQYAYEAMGYARMGIDVLNTFSDFSKAYNNYLHPADKKEKSYSQTQAAQLLDKISKMPKEDLENLESLKKIKQELDTKNGFLEVVTKIEQKANPNQQNQNGNNQNRNQGKGKNKNK